MVGVVPCWLAYLPLTMSYLFASGIETCEEGMKSSISLYASASYILIVISALIVVIAFFGCCGAFKVNRHYPDYLRNIFNKI